MSSMSRRRALQAQHQQTAAGNPALRASVNHGQPAVAATSRPNEFTGRGVVAARPAVTPAAVGAHETTPALRAPTAAGAHPGGVTPGASVAHPVTAGTARVGPAVQPHTATPAAVHPVGPAASHPMAPVAHPAAAPRPAPAPHPAPASHPAPQKEEKKS